jgi:peptidoglycan/xylan/chitin deacetylase (PgdA/CDA1 family)
MSHESTPRSFSATRGSLDRLLRLSTNERHVLEPSKLQPGLQRLSHGPWRLFAEVGEPASSDRRDDLPSFSLSSGARVGIGVGADGASWALPFSSDRAYDNYLFESWKKLEPSRDLSPLQLNAFYRVKRFVPRSAQLSARRVRIRRHGLPSFPEWPLDRSVLRLLWLHVRCAIWESQRHEAGFEWFWPDGKRAAVILTHDVESDEGLRLALEVADLEEELGFRSSFNLGGWYEVDPGLLHELRSRGFEIGIHGLRHDRSLFASRQAFDSALPALAQLAQRYGAAGFRSPATHRVTEWFRDLPVSYDCSIPHSDPFEPQTGGCCTLWPFFLGNVVELPYTLPQDHALLTLLQHRNADLWITQVGKIEKYCGLVQCITHPDPGYLGDHAKRAIYREFLEALAERDTLWKALPLEVAEWWRRRDRAEEPLATGLVRIGDDIDSIEFIPPASESGPGPRDAPATEAVPVTAF